MNTGKIISKLQSSNLSQLKHKVHKDERNQQIIIDTDSTLFQHHLSSVVKLINSRFKNSRVTNETINGRGGLGK